MRRIDVFVSQLVTLRDMRVFYLQYNKRKAVQFRKNWEDNKTLLQ
jgi:hypothetical protein